MRRFATPRAALAAALLAAGCGSDDSSSDSGGQASTSTPAPAASAPAPAPAQPPARPALGIGDQNAAMFTSPQYQALQVKYVRLVASYDTMDVKFERDIVGEWLKNAKATGAEPFVTFGHSRVRPDRLPSVEQFRKQFRAFRAEYPQVRVYAPWNEINHKSQPTSDNPERAAQYYDVVKDECDGCTVLAGDVLDQKGMAQYLRRYEKALKGKPEIWGLHNYADANRFRSSGLKTLLRTVSGQVWLTETGGIVSFGRSFPPDEQRATKALRHVLDLAKATERVQRVYLYNWTGAAKGARFDAGLVDAKGKPRPAYDVLRAELAPG